MDTRESSGSTFITEALHRKKYCNIGALNSKKTPTSSIYSFCKGKMRPLNRSRRVDIESPNWHDTRESDGSTVFTKNLLKENLIIGLVKIFKTVY